MKLIITETQAKLIAEKNIFGRGKDWVANKAGKMAYKNPEMAKKLGVETDPMSMLSPEMQARFNDIDIEKDSPDLYKFLQSMQSMKDEDDLKAALSGKLDTDVPGEAGKPEIPEGGVMMSPLGVKSVITSPYGKRNPKVGSKNHGGIDLRANSGSPVYAPLDGVIIRAEDTSKSNPCGGHIRIKHGRGVETKFCHLKKWTVKRGDKVKKGEVIGYSGGGVRDPYRGTSTGSHLHYEIVVNGVGTDPLKIQKNLV